jgi:hypothetical protein
MPRQPRPQQRSLPRVGVLINRAVLVENLDDRDGHLGIVRPTPGATRQLSSHDARNDLVERSEEALAECVSKGQAIEGQASGRGDSRVPPAKAHSRRGESQAGARGASSRAGGHGGGSAGQVEGSAALPRWAHFIAHIRSSGLQPQGEARSPVVLGVAEPGCGAGEGGGAGAGVGCAVVGTGVGTGDGPFGASSGARGSGGAVESCGGSTQTRFWQIRSPLQSVSLPQPGSSGASLS